MSRGDQKKLFNQTMGENKAYNAEAQTSYNAAQQDIGNYASEVGAFKAANPYVRGGEFETAANQELSDTASAGAQALGQTLQGQSVRTGQNAGGAIAATKDVEARNMRELSDEEARANQQRIGGEVGYGEAGLAATGEIETMQDRLAREQAEAAQGVLGPAEEAAKTPSFMEELGGAFATGLGSAAGAGAKAMLMG